MTAEELKPTDKGYREALAEKIVISNDFQKNHTKILAKTMLERGYTLAIEHNNLPELIEAAKAVVDYFYAEKVYAIVKLKEALTKAEQNKLNK